MHGARNTKIMGSIPSTIHMHVFINMYVFNTNVFFFFFYIIFLLNILY